MGVMKRTKHGVNTQKKGVATVVGEEHLFLAGNKLLLLLLCCSRLLSLPPLVTRVPGSQGFWFS